MMKSNIAERIGAWAEEKLHLPFTVYMDLMPDADGDGCCIRHDPAPAAEKRCIDGTRLVSWRFTFFVRGKDAAKAREHTKAIVDAVDGAVIGEGADALALEAATLAQYIDTDAKGYTTYSASIKCTYLEQ